MSYALHFSDGSEESGGWVVHLGSGGGVKRLAAWVASLPKDFPTLKILFDTGEVSDTATLSDELDRALEEHTPKDQATHHTAEELLDRIGLGHADERARIVGAD